MWEEVGVVYFEVLSLCLSVGTEEKYYKPKLTL
jgi:hypothetical protein